MFSLRNRNTAVLAVLLVIVGVFALSLNHVPREVRASPTGDASVVN
jgi:hypothetical protein